MMRKAINQTVRSDVRIQFKALRCASSAMTVNARMPISQKNIWAARVPRTSRKT